MDTKHGVILPNGDFLHSVSQLVFEIVMEVLESVGCCGGESEAEFHQPIEIPSLHVAETHVERKSVPDIFLVKSTNSILFKIAVCSPAN